MAGKSNKTKNKGRALNANTPKPESKPADSSVSSGDNAGAIEVPNGEANMVADTGSKSPIEDGSVDGKVEATNPPATTSKQAEGDLHLYHIPVKTQSGEKLELQLSPGDSVMDVRQFLLDAPETCFFTCYDLILHTKDGSAHHLEDYNEISEVADITTGGCSLEMVAALYDERSIRSHVRRARELLLSTLNVSLSTSLALQQETTQQKPADVGKADAPELDGLGIVADITCCLNNILTSTPKEIMCVESIVFSSFNPPPNYRRLLGDLIYIDVATLEGNKFCITGTTKGFYVNSSTKGILDPRPSKSAYEASSLIGLLQKISSKFKKGFREILDRKSAAHPFENVQSLLPPNSWLETYPIPDHKRDAARAEDALALSYGSELIGMQRDWNEELQSCREFPHTTLQERILRGRALYKVSCDFVDAAVKGAIGVISRCIPPINPTDPECFHMYVHNNIFFSFAVDSDLSQITKNQEMNSHHETENCENRTSSDSLAKTVSEGTCGNSSQCTSASPNAGQCQGVSDVTSDASAEAQITDSEQATYASANNDLKGTKAYQEADVSGLYNLAMAIIDYRGYRVVAQSIIPGILQGDKSDSLLYGSVDNGKKISWNESFHSKVVEAAKRLHLKEHAVLDGSGNVINLAAPVECKGIVGSDDRHYLLDLMRVTPRDANFIGPQHRFCTLRPELIASFSEVEAAAKSTMPKIAGEALKDSDSQSVATANVTVNSDSKDAAVEVLAKAGENCTPTTDRHDSSCTEILFNPNVFTEFKLAGSQEEIASDEALVRKAGLYLLDVVLPKFAQDLCSLEVSPMDGQTLTDALHGHGINVRYLGKVADMVKHLPHLWDLCSTEIVIRSAKHIIKDILRESLDHDVGPAIAHFLNCFVGNILPVGTKGGANGAQSKGLKKGQENVQIHKSQKGQMRWSHGASARKGLSTHIHLTSNGVWSNIQEFARSKYQFEVPDDARLRVKKVAVIRNLCQKIGASVAARKYDLDVTAPFQASDILNLQPVVKHSVPVCSEARNLMEAGKARLAEGVLNEAYTLFSEAFSLLQQITGPMHRDVANCCRYLATVLYHAGDMAGAIVQQHKELIINERCLGLDHPDTAHSYGNMALFYHALNQTELALRHMSRTLLLLSLSSGPDHPDVAATFINIAMMYQDVGNMNTALRYLQEALKTNERLLGAEHIQTAVCYHALAIAFNCMGAYKLSIQHEKKTYDILVKQLGEEDSRTRDSENWIKTFKMREQQVNTQKQKGQAVNSTSALKAIDMLKAHPDLVQAFQAATIGSGTASATAVNRSLNAAVVGEGLPRGRGVDERAARAAAEVRRKAAARGLLSRQNAPVNSPSSLTQLLNIINSNIINAEAPGNTQASEAKGKPSSDPTPNGTTADAKDANGPAEKCEDKAPVGLGASLGSLESKKQKSKPKVTA